MRASYCSSIPFDCMVRYLHADLCLCVPTVCWIEWGESRQIWSQRARRNHTDEMKEKEKKCTESEQLWYSHMHRHWHTCSSSGSTQYIRCSPLSAFSSRMRKRGRRHKMQCRTYTFYEYWTEYSTQERWWNTVIYNNSRHRVDNIQ